MVVTSILYHTKDRENTQLNHAVSWGYKILHAKDREIWRDDLFAVSKLNDKLCKDEFD